MPDVPRDGKIVTFYSYKGGTGRTMALANTAWILAGAGHRVLMVDWDLESPGLHRFIHPFLDQASVAETPGLIELIRDYQWAASEAKRAREQASGPEPGPLLEPEQVREFARLARHTVSVDWIFGGGGVLHFMPSGSFNPSYSTVVAAFNWDEFYEQLQGGEFFDAMRQQMCDEYDYVLIDSRTGLSDVAEICTMHFPHTLVVCFTLSDQGIDGAAQVAKHVANRVDREIRVLPVPTRIDEGEKAKADAGRSLARARFDRLPSHMTEEARTAYWGAVEIPYRPFYAYEETLAVFGDPPGLQGSLLSGFERLVGYLTEGRVTAAPTLAGAERERVLASFIRRRVQPAGDLTVGYVPEDRLWAEWIAGLLEHAGARVRLYDADGGDPESDPDAPAPPPEGRTVVAVVSRAFLASREAVDFARGVAAPGSRPGRGRLVPVHVAELRSAEPLGGQPPVELAGLAAAAAAAAVLDALDLAPPPSAARPLQQRYPASVPAVWNAAPRNANFTGRNPMLGRLREQLAAESVSVVLPIALHGLGGVGKTQIALEYVHRFKADYNLIWWVDAEQPSLINQSLAELAGRLGVRVGESEAEAAREALQRLRTGQPYGRWLLVLDNAVDPADLRAYLPGGPGHTLITSRNQSWAQTAAPLQVDAFAREESVAHLSARLPRLSSSEADTLAEALGDLPLAVEVASAWLSETGTPVGEYLRSLEERSPEVLSLSRPNDYPRTLMATWQISIDRLAERSRAGVRLLELCAHMAPTISLDLIYGQQTADSLVPLDASLRVPMMLGRVVQEINRLALARVDTQRNELQIHRLMQAYLRTRLDEQQSSDTVHVVHRILVAGKPQRGGPDDPRNWPVYSLLWPHLRASRAVNCDEEPVRELLIDWVRFQWQDGALDSALALARQLDAAWGAALAGQTAQAPGDEAQILLRRQHLFLRYHIACIYRSMGDYSQAYAIDQEVFAEQSDVLDRDDLHTLMTAGTLAADLRGLGEYAQARTIDEGTYASLKELFGEDHERTLSAANNLAISVRATGSYRQALVMDEDTLRRRRSVSGTRHPNTLSSMAAVGRNLRLLGEYEGSVAVLEDAYLGYSATLVETAAGTLRTGTSLALSLRLTGALAKARELTAQVSSRYAALSTDESPDALAHRLNVAADQAAAGDPDRAAATAQEALDAYRRRVGDDHPYTHLCRSSLSVYLLRAGRIGEARVEAEPAADALARKLAPQHPLAQAAAQNLANCLARSGRADAAEEVDRRVYQDAAGLLGPTHPETLGVGLNLADDLALLGRTGESEVLRGRLLPQLADRLGANHPAVAALRSGQRADREMEPMPT